MTNDTISKPIVVRCSSCAALNRVDLSRLEQGPKCAKCSAALRLDGPHAVTDADFERMVSGASVPVIVDFYADWCGPCRAMAPALDAFAARRQHDVLVLKLDTDANPDTASRFGIRSIPTLITFRDGKEAKRHVGAANPSLLDSLVEGT